VVGDDALVVGGRDGGPVARCGGPPQAAAMDPASAAAVASTVDLTARTQFGRLPGSLSSARPLSRLEVHDRRDRRDRRAEVQRRQFPSGAQPDAGPLMPGGKDT
jgi:hypothetical protein